MADSPTDAENFYEFANQFLDENSHLFTILGIFGAIAVYLGRLTTEMSSNYLDVILNVGVFASLSLFVLVGALIDKCYKDGYEEFSGVPLVESRLPLISLALFDFLVVTVFSLVIATLRESWTYFLFLALSLVLVHGTVLLISSLARQINGSEQSSFKRSLFQATVLLTIPFLIIWWSVLQFVYPVLSPSHYLTVSSSMIVIGATLALSILFTIEVRPPWW